MNTNNSQRAVAWWLFACCAMVFLTMVVGGVTRLTHSGLSIVEWKPLIGALPPLSHADWMELFAKYQQTPEFIQRNHDMTLDGFQFIFWWEWAHRLLGRSIGLVFFLPYAWFLIRGKLRGALAVKVFGFFILGGLQGAMGWYMVKSGLVDDPRVSQYRLAAHLGLAFLLFGLMGWTGLGMLQPRKAQVGAGDTPTSLTLRLGTWLVALVFVMVLSGALVAGIHAGLAYNTFPLMNGHFVPPEILMVEPLWLNFFTNMATVQFDHRLIAWLLMGLIPWFSWRTWNETPSARTAAVALTLWLAVQVSLGIATLLLQVPVALAATHQAGAMVLFGLVLWTNHAIRRA
ncbi:MAG: heme A synthase [Rhodocyclales bacterium RIFCSPLOWO2_02_FULL_63_24]|nr:MAG: heme A synthase [Rhodocyclales bacterium GWA2_65_19]OHC71212.1 MAG: heme A synthase [Rhodocyclales bacterium RIFCSPLOWO2_02_FULL_63_24]